MSAIEVLGSRDVDTLKISQAVSVRAELSEISSLCAQRLYSGESYMVINGRWVDGLLSRLRRVQRRSRLVRNSNALTSVWEDASITCKSTIFRESILNCLHVSVISTLLIFLIGKAECSRCSIRFISRIMQFSRNTPSVQRQQLFLQFFAPDVTSSTQNQ
jgi:hypothetical protein